MTAVRKNISVICVLAAGILWGIIGLFVRHLNAAGFDSMEITEVRSFVSMILMGVFLLIIDRKAFRIRLKDIWCFIGTGIVSLTFFNICYFTTMTLTSLSVAATLLYTAPAMVMIMSAFLFGEKLNRIKLLSVALAFAGCVLVTGVLADNPTISAFGILAGIGSGFGYALYSIFGRFAVNRGYGSMTITFYTMVFSALGGLMFLHPAKLIAAVGEDVSVLFFYLGLALFSTCLAYIFYTMGLKGMENGKASILASIEPVTATVMGVLVFGEKISMMTVAGVVLVLASIAIVNLHKQDR